MGSLTAKSKPATLMSNSNLIQSPLKTTREKVLMWEKNFHTEPFTNFYPVGGGGWVIANP